jgi:hypothetical protein
VALKIIKLGMDTKQVPQKNLVVNVDSYDFRAASAALEQGIQ